MEEKTLELNKSHDYNEVKLAIQEACNISDMTGKVIKIRNKEGALIPPSFLLADSNTANTFTVEITKITCNCT